MPLAKLAHPQNDAGKEVACIFTPIFTLHIEMYVGAHLRSFHVERVTHILKKKTKGSPSLQRQRVHAPVGRVSGVMKCRVLKVPLRTGGRTRAVLKNNGIEFQTTVAERPKKNGMAAIKRRILWQRIRSMIFDACLPTTIRLRETPAYPTFRFENQA